MATKTWRPRFSLRVFLVAFTLASLWFGWRISAVNRIEGAIDSIERLGGRFEYPLVLIDENLGYKPGNLDTTRRRNFAEKVLLGYRARDLPVWCGFGLKAMSNFPRESTDNEVVNDAVISQAFPHLLLLPTVTNLYLDDTKVTGLTCRLLSGLPTLRRASFEKTNLSNDDIDDIASLAMLEYVSVANTKVDRSGGRELEARMPGCEVVVIHKTRT